VSSDISGAQGQWIINNEGDNKITGTENMQLDTGVMLTYTIHGITNYGPYTLNLANRSDGKKGCIFSGSVSLNADQKSHRLIGEVHCDGVEKFYIRGGY
jgi:hypothetical protein